MVWPFVAGEEKVLQFEYINHQHVGAEGRGSWIWWQFPACRREKHSLVSIMNFGNVAQTNISFQYPLQNNIVNICRYLWLKSSWWPRSTLGIAECLAAWRTKQHLLTLRTDDGGSSVPVTQYYSLLLSVMGHSIPPLILTANWIWSNKAELNLCWDFPRVVEIMPLWTLQPLLCATAKPLNAPLAILFYYFDIFLNILRIYFHVRIARDWWWWCKI